MSEQPVHWISDSNPGPLVTQPASLQILNFTSDGTLSTCTSNVQGYCATGDVTGTLPGILTFDNGTGFNDCFDDLTFGNGLSFDVSLYGPALNVPKRHGDFPVPGIQNLRDYAAATS